MQKREINSEPRMEVIHVMNNVDLALYLLHREPTLPPHASKPLGKSRNVYYADKGSN